MVEKTIAELAEEKRKKTGAEQYGGHTFMDLMRFDDHTQHMIIFDVCTRAAHVGEKGERLRLFLSDEGYAKAGEDEKRGNIRIRSHAAVVRGHLYYDREDMER